MSDDRIEQLLRGYRLPAASPDLDRRVLAGAAAILVPASDRLSWTDVAHTVLHRSGFGVVAWLIDLVTQTDAEYRVAAF